MPLTELHAAVCTYCSVAHSEELIHRAKVILFRPNGTAVEVVDLDLPVLSSSDFPVHELAFSLRQAGDGEPPR
jgi:hypothetical protein